jgi:hypothetical protein
MSVNANHPLQVRMHPRTNQLEANAFYPRGLANVHDAFNAIGTATSFDQMCAAQAAGYA